MKNPKSNKLIIIFILFLSFSSKMIAQHNTIDISYSYPSISKYEVLDGVQMHSLKAAYNYEIIDGLYFGWMGDFLLFKNIQDGTLANSILLGGKLGVRPLATFSPQIVSRLQPILEIDFLQGLKKNIGYEYGGLIGFEYYFSDKSAMVLSFNNDYYLLNDKFSEDSQTMSLFSMSFGLRFGF